MISFTQQEAEQFFKKARRVVKHPGFDILVASSHASESRFMVITPKALGNAVKRNKIRRQIKAIFYEEKLANPSADCAIIVKKPALAMNFAELKESLIKALHKSDEKINS